MEDERALRADYPWIRTPLVIGAPMRLIALAELATEISKAGGIGFIGAGTDVSDLSAHLTKAKKLLENSGLESIEGTLPVGVGFINWGASLPQALPVLKTFKPAAAWLFAPTDLSSLSTWTASIRTASPHTKIWLQIGSVAEAREVFTSNIAIDVLVVQGTDAGGHGLARGASIVTLVPEVSDLVTEVISNGSSNGDVKEVSKKPVLVAAGGISEPRSAAAALMLGAAGLVLGTRFLASHEAVLSKGYRDEVVRASDGGQTTARTKVYDHARGTVGWADSHNARGILNRTFWDEQEGKVSREENRRLYEVEMGKGDEGWGVDGRMTAYAGSGVGLVKEVKSARDIVEEIREGARGLLGDVAGRW